jgi:hypothetical protein
MRFARSVDEREFGVHGSDVKEVDRLTTANWPMFRFVGYEPTEMAEVLSHRFVARGVAPRLGALGRPVPRTHRPILKEPADRVSAAVTVVSTGTVSTEDLYPCCPSGPFLPRKAVSPASKHLRGLLSRTGWWRHTITAGHNQSAARAWIEEQFRSCGVKVLGETKVVSAVRGEKPCSLELVKVSVSGGEGLWVSVDLLALLCAVRLFRPLTEGLVASLRGRSRLWAESVGLEVVDLVQFLPGTLALACLPSHGEVVAMRAFRGVGYQWSADVLGSFSKGVVAEPRAPWLRWTDVLRGWAGGGLAGAFERPVQSLVLPS